MKISIDQLKIGDKLLQDIINQNGTRIAESGTMVDSLLLLRCKTWSIKEVEIVSEKQEEDLIVPSASEGVASLGINPIMDKILQIAEKIKDQRIKKVAVK